MNFKWVLVSVLVLMIVLSGCAQQKTVKEEAPVAEPAYEEPAAPAPAPEAAPASPPALPEVQAASSCENLVAQLEDLSAKGFPTGACKYLDAYQQHFNLDVDEDRDIDAQDLALAQQNKGNEQWCSIRLNRNQDKENPCKIQYYEFPSCGSAPIRGDFNGDGKVTKRDAATQSIYVILATYPKRAGEFVFYPIQGNQCCADIDGDGTIGAKDIDAMNRVLDGVKSPQNC